jgi:hypothetical protein
MEKYIPTMERDLAIHNSSYYFVQYRIANWDLKLIENTLAEFKNSPS